MTFGGAGSNSLSETWFYGLGSEYRTFGAGCQSAPQGCKPCISTNWTNTLAGSTTQEKRIAIFELSRDVINICGATLYCSARNGTEEVTVSIYDDDRSGPGKVLRSTKIRVGPTAAVHTAKFPVLRLEASTAYYIAFDNADKLKLPISKTGSKVLHYEASASTWTFQFEHPWQYQVLCDSGLRIPRLSSTERPTIDSTFHVALENAPNNRPSILFVGFSDTAWGSIKLPLELKPFAPGCTIFSSGELPLGFVTDGNGAASVPLRIPNLASLRNLVFFNQFFISDPAANGFGLIMSNAAKATIRDL